MALPGTASKRLRLVLVLGDLGGLGTDTAGVSQTSVDFSHFEISLVKTMIRAELAKALQTLGIRARSIVIGR